MAKKKEVKKCNKKPPVKKAVKTTKPKAVKKNTATKITPKKKTKSINTNLNKRTTDKVGDVLINQAGVKYKITAQKLVPVTGNNENGKIKTRVFEITPLTKSVNGGKPFLLNENSVKYSRDKKILVREKQKVNSNGKK